MKILAIEREQPDASPDTFKLHAEEEARKAWELHQAGLIRELYFRTDQSTAGKEFFTGTTQALT